MGEELKMAARKGDVEFLKRAVAESKPPIYFKPDSPDDNIMHLAVTGNHVEFLRVAMEILEPETVLELLSHKNKWVWNYLFVAVHRKPSISLEMVRLALDFYKKYLPPSSPSIDNNNSSAKPWLAVDDVYRTSLHLALVNGTEEVAMEIMSMDMELLCNMVDSQGRSTLYYAVYYGKNRVAEKILTSSFNYSLQGPSTTPLHVVPNSSEIVCRLLLKKHPNLLDEVDEDGRSVLHKCVLSHDMWPLKMVIEEFSDVSVVSSKVLRNLCCMSDKPYGDYPLHTAAAKSKRIDHVQLLVRYYQKKVGAEMPVNYQFPESDHPPWKSRNKNDDTPLHSALSSKNEQVALYFVELDSTLCQLLNNKNESPLFIAVDQGLGKFVKQILEGPHDVPFNTLRRYDGVTLLHLLPSCPEETGKLVLNKFWWMINLRDDMGRTALDRAKEASVPWLVKLLMDPSLIDKEKFNWIKACEAEETWPILGYVDSCQDLQQVYLEDNDTPSHHIKRQSYEDYLKFLKISSVAELKNATDFEGATPLHRALERKDIYLAKALLIDVGVERNMKDCRGITAMDLLAKLCKPASGNWAMMCKQIKVNPYLKTNYIQPGTNMDSMRNTLSVVAALLATITFTAGFTLPGGLTTDGDANKGKKASFIVFLLADAYAMCTSIMVLFCVIWSMVSTRDMAYFLVDRSVWILMHSLYGTIVAFMTGIYSTMTHSSLWAIIVIFVMCSFIGIAVNKTFLQKVLFKLIPTTFSNQKDSVPLVQEGNATS